MNSGQKNIQTDRLSAGISVRQIEKLEILSMDLEELKKFIDSEQLSNPMIEAEDYSMPGAVLNGTGFAASGDGGELYDLSGEESVELSEYLVSQLPEKDLTRQQLYSIVRTIACLDTDTGYFSGTEEEMEEQTGLSPDQIRFAVEYIRGLEPAGVGARDLSDCLCLQLERTGELDEPMRKIITGHLGDIASGQISRISRDLGLPTGKVRDYIARIRSLDPRPAARFGRSSAVYVVPDASASYEEGKWTIEILGISRSCVHMNRAYEKMAREAEDPETVRYFAEKITRAKEILSAIEQREDTIREMLQMVLEAQTDFCLGRGPLKYLPQKDVAEKLGVHPSTVNRAARNKYILLPRGTVEIRRLFSAKSGKKPGKEAVGEEAGKETVSPAVHETLPAFAGRQEEAAEAVRKARDQGHVAEICLIAPTEALLEQNRRVCAHYDKKVDGFPGSVTKKALDTAMKLKERGARVFISRRGTKKTLEDAGLTVVEIPTHFRDYLPVMERARLARGPVAFFSYGVPPSEIRELCMLLGIEARFYSYYDLEECEKSVERAMEDGVLLGIGSADTSWPAARAGLEYIIIENSEEALLSAIESAEQVLSVMKAEQERQRQLRIRLERYEMVFGFTHDAIIGVDREGRIEVLNREAEKFFPVSGRSVIGTALADLIPEAKVSRVLQTGSREIDQLIRIGRNMISMNCVPIMAEGRIYGAVATFQDVRTIQKNEQKIRIKMNEKGLTAKYHFEDILGRSQSIRTAVRMARKYANSGATVMIHGETGTGKEMFAQSIHNASARASGPFVAVNCGSLPKDILEAELFGYVEGAFTGALKGGKMGLFEMAHGGTIFLDEIGEMPLQTQVQMLRVLQEKEIRRVGSDKVTPIDIRVVAATHRDLSEAVRRGEFREDLYYRLNILNLEIPPLRERGEDLLEIGLSVYASFGEHEAEDEEEIREILTGLSDYAWPGNIRELSNMMERCYVLRSQGESFDFIRSLTGPSVAFREEKTAEREERRNSACGYVQDSLSGSDFLPVAGRAAFDKVMLSKSDSRQEKERREILDALAKNDMEITRTAQALSMSRSTLWRKMKKYGISIT